MYKRSLLLLCSLLLTPIVEADINFYGGIQWGSYDHSNQVLPIEVNNKAVALIGGFSFLPWLSAELRGGSGVGQETTEVDYQGTPEEIKLKIKGFASTYLRPELRLKYFTLYGLVGAAAVKYDGESENIDLDQEGYEVDVSYGGGIAVINSDQVSFGIEYVQLIDSDAYILDGMNITVQFRF